MYIREMQWETTTTTRLDQRRQSTRSAPTIHQNEFHNISADEHHQNEDDFHQIKVDNHHENKIKAHNHHKNENDHLQNDDDEHHGLEDEHQQTVEDDDKHLTCQLERDRRLP